MTSACVIPTAFGSGATSSIRPGSRSFAGRSTTPRPIAPPRRRAVEGPGARPPRGRDILRPMRAIPLARSARRRLKLDPPILDASGTLDARDTAAARRIAVQLNRARTEGPPVTETASVAGSQLHARAASDDAPSRANAAAPAETLPQVGAGDLVALAALDAVLHRVLDRH